MFASLAEFLIPLATSAQAVQWFYGPCVTWIMTELTNRHILSRFNIKGSLAVQGISLAFATLGSFVAQVGSGHPIQFDQATTQSLGSAIGSVLLAQKGHDYLTPPTATMVVPTTLGPRVSAAGPSAT